MNTKQTFFCALIFALVGLFFSGCHDDYRYGAGVEENGTNNDVNNIDDVVSNPLVTCEANDTRTIDPDGNSSTVVTDGQGFLMLWRTDSRDELMLLPFNKHGVPQTEPTSLLLPSAGAVWSLSALPEGGGYNVFVIDKSTAWVTYLRMNSNANVLFATSISADGADVFFLGHQFHEWQHKGNWVMYRNSLEEPRTFILASIVENEDGSILDSRHNVVIDSEGFYTGISDFNTTKQSVLYALWTMKSDDSNHLQFFLKKNESDPVLVYEINGTEDSSFWLDITSSDNGYVVNLNHVVSNDREDTHNKKVLSIAETGEVLGEWESDRGTKRSIPVLDGIGVLAKKNLQGNPEHTRDTTLSIFDPHGRPIGGPYLVGFDPDDFYGPYPDMIASTNGVILMLGVGDGIRLKRIVCTKE